VELKQRSTGDLDTSNELLHCLLALDRNVRVLSPIEMSVYRREAVCREELCDGEAGFKLPVCRLAQASKKRLERGFDERIVLKSAIETQAGVAEFWRISTN
jgi:hypothetical protein